MNVRQSKHCCGVYLVSGKIVDYAGQRRFSSHGHSHVADWFAKLGHICKMTWVKRYLAMGVSAADCHKAANVKGICTGILTFTQMRLTKVLGICRERWVITYPLIEVLNGNTQGFTKSMSPFYASCFIHCVEAINHS
jgi:hypothetical protein